MPDRPPTEPVFTDTMQIGIVVPDLDAAVRTYRDVYGIGPWEVFEVGPDNSHDVRLYGRPVEWRGRAAVTMVVQRCGGRLSQHRARARGDPRSLQRHAQEADEGALSVKGSASQPGHIVYPGSL